MERAQTKQVFYQIDHSHVSTEDQLTRFGAPSFYHVINLLRRRHSSEACRQFPVLKKMAEAFDAFLLGLEEMRSQTPCIVGRFHSPETVELLSSVRKETAHTAYQQFQAAKHSSNPRTFPLQGVDRHCRELDLETMDTHVSIENWLDSFTVEGEENETFNAYCMRKMACRIYVYVSLLTNLDAAEADIKNLLEANVDDRQRLLLANEVARGIVSHRFAFNSSAWKKEAEAFPQLMQELAEKGPLVVFGNLPPLCYKAAAKVMGTFNGIEVKGWSKGSEAITRPFSHAVVIVGCEKGESQERVYFKTPIDNYKDTFACSYRKLRESVETIFHETYALYLSQ